MIKSDEIDDRMLELFVPGKPAPQGSKSFKGMRGGHAILAESSKLVKPWRKVVADTWAATHDHTIQPGVPVTVDLVFVMPRPKATPKSRPTPPAVKRNGDIDKLARAVLDALVTGRAFSDDSQVIKLSATKRIAEAGEQSGVHIVVAEVPWQSGALITVPEVWP